MNWLTSRIAVVAAVAGLLATTGCDKGTELNVDLPETAAINSEYLDLRVEAATVQLKPVETLKADSYLVGRLRESTGGLTEARAYFNVVASGRSDSLPARFLGRGPILDSVVVVMNFDQVYGSAATPARFDVFRLADKLDEREVYNSTSSVPLGAALRTNVAVPLNQTRQVTTPASAASPAVTTTVPNKTVRIVLQRVPTPGNSQAITSALATDLFRAMQEPTFNQTRLESVLKGLAFAPAAGSPYDSSILSFARGSAGSRLVVYYRTTTEPIRSSYAFGFGAVYSSQGDAVARDPRYFTQITTEFAGTPLSSLSSSTSAVPATALGNSAYMQEGIGLGTRIRFTGLEALRNKPGLAINRAELRVPVKPFTNALFPNPGAIFALEVDANNRILQRSVSSILYDRVVQADGASSRGINTEALGLLTSSASAQPYYSLFITNYLQAYLTEKLDGALPEYLVLVPNIRRSPTLGLNRAVVDADKIRLRVYYSQLR